MTASTKARPDRALARLAWAFIAAAFVAACGDAGGPSASGPLFTDPVEKIAQTASESFTKHVADEAIALQPLLATPGTQVHMGFWSRSANRTRLMAMIDQINAMPAGVSPQWAVWDEGVSTSAAGRYPHFIALEREYWYDRAQAEVGGFDTVILDGVAWRDPFPVTFEQADRIWAQASARYAETAATYHRATGKVVQVWAFVHGADPTRIFFRDECPKLTTLRLWGHVQVQCSRVAEADWRDPAQWCDCSQACAPCAQ